MSLNVRLSLGDKPKIAVSGRTIEVLKSEQLGSVLMGRGDLVDRVKRHQNYGTPDGVHLSDSDGLAGKLAGTFSKYRWRPCQLLLRAKGARIVSAPIEPTVYAQQPGFNADLDNDLEMAHNLRREVTNRVAKERHWSIEAGITQTVSYEVGGDAAGFKVGGSTALNFSSSYGENKTQEEAVAIGSEVGAKTVLQPGEGTMLELNVNVGKIEAQVDYEREVRGGVFVHYGKRKGGHYFWYVPIGQLYSASELRAIQSESLHVDVFYSASVHQRELEPGEIYYDEWQAWQKAHPKEDETE